MPMLKYIYAVLAVAAISLGLFSPSYFFLNKQKNQKLELHFSDNINHASVQFRAVNNAYTLLAKNVYDNIINKREIVSLVKKANAVSPAQKAVLRQTLYTKLLPLYKNLQKQNIAQLHFHLKNSVSFLQFRHPNSFGNSLEAAGYSIDKVNRTRRPIFGFEEGPFFNGFRQVFPLTIDNKFAGTVEISYSFDAIKAEEMKLRSAYYDFIIRKDIISSKSWKKAADEYVSSPLSTHYLQDKNTSNQETQNIFTQDLINAINADIRAEADIRLDTEEDFILHTKVGNEDYIIMFIPIYNVEKRQVAYYISYEKNSTVSLIEQTYKIELLLSSIVSFVLALILVLYVISQKRATKALELLATTDPLTNIANRNKLNIILEKSIHVSLRYKLPLSIIFFDIDHFKKINDTQGHEAGDTVLTSISALISHHIRSSDIFARWGGEEFIIVLPETEQADAKQLAEKFRRLIQEYKFLPNVDVTCSFGVTQLRDNDDEASLLKRVDNALYSAKEHGRNRVIEIS